MTTRQRCGLCNEVTAGFTLVRYDGVCFYCWLDTSTSEDANFVRSRFYHADTGVQSPQSKLLHRVAQLHKRRLKRGHFWGDSTILDLAMEQLF